MLDQPALRSRPSRIPAPSLLEPISLQKQPDDYDYIKDFPARHNPEKNDNKKSPENQGFRGTDLGASTIEHNRFVIVRVCQVSDDIWFPYIALLGVLYS